MKTILNRLFDHGSLDRDTARTVLINIAQEKYNYAQIASFLTVYLMRSITVDELAGFREALLELCLPVKLNAGKTIDVCGTGGDGKDTFNISTLTAFVVAGAGYKVVKHGNYSVSSSCGSSNVLEHFGAEFTNDTDQLNKQLEKAGICFLHAPLFHPAMKTVAPVRRELGIKTFFNMLGPLVNPAQPSHQMIGVFSLELARMYHYLLQEEDVEYAVLYDLAGYDEISLTGKIKLFTRRYEKLIDPGDIVGQRFKEKDLFGGQTVKEAAEIFEQVLTNKGTEAQTQVVLANAALALQLFQLDKSIEDCIEEARNSLASGKAHETFKSFLNS